MIKEFIVTTDTTMYLKAMSGEDGIVCEFKGEIPSKNEPCTIDSIRYEPHTIGSVYTYMDVTLLRTGEQRLECEPNDIVLYHRTFENGDYISRWDGSIFICAGEKDGKYLYHAALSVEGNLSFPDMSRIFGCVKPSDRLCTKKEIMRLNGELMRAGKIFDPVAGKIVEGAVTKDAKLFAKVLKQYELHQASKVNPSMTEQDIKVGTFLRRKGIREYYRIVSTLCFPWGDATKSQIVIEQVFTTMPCFNTISKEKLIEEMEVYHGEDF